MPCYADQSLSSDKSCHRVTLFLTQIPLLMKISYINVNFLHKSGVFSELLQCLQFHKITSFKKVNMPKRNIWGWHSGLLQSFLGGIPGPQWDLQPSYLVPDVVPYIYTYKALSLNIMTDSLCLYVSTITPSPGNLLSIMLS